MPSLISNGISIAYETAGDPKAMPVLLVMGLGMQLTAWPADFVDGLVDLDYYVIRFDNRDSGLSTKFKQAGTPSLPLVFLKSRLHLPVRSAYRLDDMADDALGVLNTLGVAKAHVAGLSMGGMIAQILTARHPERILSLTSLMSSSGRRGLPGPTRQARAALMARPPHGADPERMLGHLANMLRVVGSPAYPTPEKQLRAAVAAALLRNSCPAGMVRQLVAIIASSDRCALLRSIERPTLVIHGAADPLVPVAAGIDTARLVPGARLEVIEGMGHDLPGQLIERLLALIDTHTRGKMAPDIFPRLFEKQ
ncbi:alpha/beta fold hydrolase [Massilia psychrophila]|uniref:Alpha/beta hydrolase n=1 Tax=Massilia psychrophila TaxID=1603353 RepID=A0A2G8T2D3_9BURK|nr:alpha/beta hydrolase [Massilia psychrophila]PIL40220.1 alpha/beta hydrolase [Massilia psychrophila]GGE75991.1 hydrolase [Massilia psychrophila]